MNNVGIVPVRDYVEHVATEDELDQLERLIQKRREVLRQRANPPEDPMRAARELSEA